MKRREFITLLGGAAAWPLAARGQQSGMPLIGILSSTSETPYKPFVGALYNGLKEQGFEPGKSVVVEQRWADGQYDRLPTLARELIGRRANVIVAIAPPAARAAKDATSATPVVFSTSGDPVALGLVSSLNRPGGNLTGVNFQLFAMAGKRIELLTKLAPKTEVIGLLINPNNPSSKRSTLDAQNAAEALGRKLVIGSGATADEIEESFAHFVKQRADAVTVEPDPFLLARRGQIAVQAARHLLPAIYPHREYAEAGGLISYGTDLFDAYRQIGVYTGRVLRGEQPANLPVMQVTKFELLINLNTAKALGLTIPPDVLAIADEVIE